MARCRHCGNVDAGDRQRLRDVGGANDSFGRDGFARGTHARVDGVIRLVATERNTAWCVGDHRTRGGLRRRHTAGAKERAWRGVGLRLGRGCVDGLVYWLVAGVNLQPKREQTGIAVSLRCYADDVRWRVAAYRRCRERLIKQVLIRASYVAVFRRMALLDGGGLDHRLHGLRLAAARKHSGAGIHQRVCESAYCRAARQHHRTRTILARNGCGSGNDYCRRCIGVTRRGQARSSDQSQ